jgi:hypothetical protein
MIFRNCLPGLVKNVVTLQRYSSSSLVHLFKKGQKDGFVQDLPLSIHMQLTLCGLLFKLIL